MLKADVQGSLEACTESLRKLERDDVKLVIVHRGVGGITENDVQLAKASNATIIGFNVRPDKRSRELAASEGVEIRTYEIIYKLIEEIEAAMLGLLTPVFEEVVTGEAEVREVFRIPRVGAIAGCFVRDGVITRGSEGALLARGHDHLEGHDHVAASLQGRRARGRRGLRVRHRALGLPGPQGGRRHRDLRRARDSAHGISHGALLGLDHPYPRSARVNQILREVISDELVRISDVDERLGLLTVTGVETSPDMRHAMVYLDSSRTEAKDALEERRGQIQGVGQRPDASQAHAQAVLRGGPGDRQWRPPSRSSCGASAMTTSNGLLLIDKPAGVTSHDVVARVRRVFDERRVGHAGTLDPMATGLLILAVGPSTRLLRFAQGETKRYEGSSPSVSRTDSLDADGTVTETTRRADL